MKLTNVWGGVCVLLVASVVRAAPVYSLPLPGGYLDVDYFAGSGANTAYFVVDFGGNGGGTHAFGYRWDGTQTADNGLIAIVAAGALDWTFNNFGTVSQPNLFVRSFAYPPDSDLPVFGVDGRFWQSWLGTYASQSVSWAADNIGISGRDFASGDVVQTLASGEFIGFYASANNTQPRLPIAVPEPASVALLALGIIGALRWVRRRGMYGVT